MERMIDAAPTMPIIEPAMSSSSREA